MPAAPSLSLNDEAYAYYVAALAGTLPAQSVAVSGSVTTLPFNNDGISAGGAAVPAPAAAATVATTTALAAGTWDIYVTTAIAGTVAALDVTNMVVKVGGTTLFNAISSLNGSASPSPVRRLLTAGGNPVAVTAVANATAGSIYAATISAVRVR